MDKELQEAVSRENARAAVMEARLVHAESMIRHYLKCGYLPHMSAMEARQWLESLKDLN